MGHYLDRYHSSGDGMDKISMGQIRDQLSNEELTYENLFEKIAEIEARTNRLIVFEPIVPDYRHFPRIFYVGGDRLTMHVEIYLGKEEQTDARRTHLLKQVGIVIVLSCSVWELVSYLAPNESYDSFALKYKEHSDEADKFYALLDEKLNKGAVKAQM